VNAQNASQRRVKDDLGVKRLVDYAYLCLPDTIDPRGPTARVLTNDSL